MNIIQEKNLLIFVNNSAEPVGKIDINNNIIYGKTGHILKKCNNEMCTIYASMYCYERDKMPLPLKFFASWSTGLNTLLLNSFRKMILVDRLVNAKVPQEGFPNKSDPCFNDPKIFNEMISNKNFMDRVRNNDYSFTYSSFENWKRNFLLAGVFADYPQLTLEDRKMLCYVFSQCDDNKKYIKFVLGHYFFNNSVHIDLNWYAEDHTKENWRWRKDSKDDILNNWTHRLITYYWMTKKTGREWAKKDWPIDYYYATITYHSFVIASEATRFSAHTDPKILSFEYGDFTIICPKNGEDLIEEGRKMHHCVGGYVSNVLDGDCSIVFVRRKSDPSTPYITCEIRKDGKIHQYYMAFDRHISEDKDIQFKEEYSKFLLTKEKEIAEMLNRG